VKFYSEEIGQFVPAGCRYHKRKESYISQTVLNRLRVPNKEPWIQLTWMPIDKPLKTFETIFYIVSKDQYEDCDIMFGTDWDKGSNEGSKSFKRKLDESKQHVCPVPGTESIKIDRM
jgi:hypothetical protein